MTNEDDDYLEAEYIKMYPKGTDLAIMFSVDKSLELVALRVLGSFFGEGRTVRISIPGNKKL